MSDTSTNAGARGASFAPAGTARRLLPVLAMALLVFLMIRGGIARNAERHRLLANDLHRSRDTLTGFARDAARFLAGAQSPDGSWAYYRGTSPALVPADSQDRVASTARILLALRAAGLDDAGGYGRGLAYVRATARDAEPTLEALALTLLVAGDGIDATQARAWLLARPTLRGLYPRRSAAAAVRAAAVSPASLADNLLLVGGLPALGLDPAPLATAVRRRLESGTPEPSPSWTVLRAVAASAAESGPPAGRAPLAGLVARVPRPGLVDPQRDSLTLGAHVHVRAEQCLREGDPCTDLNRIVGTLAQRRRPDGSWAAAPYATEGGYSVGSPAETTAFVLGGMAAFARVLEGRAEGRLMSGEEDESRPRGRPAPAASPLRK